MKARSDNDPSVTTYQRQVEEIGALVEMLVIDEGDDEREDKDSLPGLPGSEED